MKADWKSEAVKQWNSDPCGAIGGHELGTREFFAEVERDRYDAYAPWMRSVMGFDRYAGKRLLEVGFGLGTDHVAFTRGGARCFGVDLTPTHIQATRRRLRLEPAPVRLTNGDAESLPFRTASFDVVYSFGVLHHTPDTQGSIDEVHRVLKPGGEAIIGLYHRYSAFFAYWVVVQGILRGGFLRKGYRRTLSGIERRENSDAVPLVKVYSRRSARRLFSNFEDVRIETHHFDLEQAGRIGRFVKSIFGQPRSWQALGWYLVIRARKKRHLSTESGTPV